jgi:probable HAF family extracellular repeat protein
VKPNLRSRFLFAAALLVGTVFFAAHAWTQQSTQERQLWEVLLARDAQANSTITIQNQCQQPHSFNVIQQQTPFLQLLAAPLVNVPGNSSYALPVRFNTNGMNAGQYQGTVIVKCENCGKEKGCKQDREVLPIRLTVVENAKPPQTVSTEPITATPPPTPTPSLGAALPTPSPSPSPSPSPCAPTPTPTPYALKNLSTLSEGDTAHCVATGINDGGNVVGACSPSYFGKSGGAWHAFRTEPGAVIKKEDDLSFPVGIKGGSSFATAVNGKGHVVGFWAPTGSSDVKAFWHDGGKTSKITSLHPAKSIFTISKAFALNTLDDVVGVAYGPTVKPGSALGMTFGGHAVLWPHADSASIIDLNDYMDPGSKKDWILIAAFGINDAKEIVGRALDLHLGKYHAFLLKSKGAKPIDLGALKEDIYDSSAAYAINTCGETVPLIDKVVGYTYTKKDAHYGFVWTEGVGMKDMGTLTGYPESYAQAINKEGEVVGAVGGLHTSVIFDAITCLGTCFTTPTGDAKNHAVWYNGIELKDLNKLIPAYPGWELEFANSINDKYGQIVGSGFYKPPTYKSGGLYAKAVLLTPVGLTLPAPEPIATKTTTSSACPLSIPSGGYIFDNWNVCGVKNSPTKETTFTIDAPYLITFIATYHWNSGKGALPTKGISLKDSSGKVYGPWPVTTSAGSGGAANVNWECHPGITLPAGTYTAIDPDPATWSQNDASGNVGFTRVAGAIKK